MPYVNSRGEIVQKQAWSWDSPIVALISLWNVIRLFFATMFGMGDASGKKTDKRGGFGSGGGFGSAGGGSGSGGSGGSGPSGRPGGGRGGFMTMGDIRPPPASSPCAGGSCPR